MRIAPPLLVCALLGLSGCVRPAAPTPPQAALHPLPQSELMGEIDELVAALASGEVERISGRMTPRLHEALTVADLEAAAIELREQMGRPRGIMEEHLSTEGRLTWYSGLVVHAKGSAGREVLTPVLYQVAFTPERRIERLLVREHVFIEHLQAPATAYLPVTRLHVPAAGPWLVSQGGPTRELNAHHGSVTQRFAYDLVLVIDGRFRDPEQPATDNASYYGYGKALRAPGAGTVVRVVDGVPDNVPGQLGRAGGNGLLIDHGFGEVSALWHARPGTLRVKEGDHVEAGQVVAEVGNSGRSSGAHIHFHLTRNEGDFALPAPLVDLWVDEVPQERALVQRGQVVQPRLEGLPPHLAAAPRVFVDL